MALKDLWLNIRGTLNAVLQIGGKAGVILKNSSAALLIRNAADSAAADITAAVVEALTSWKLTIGGFTATLTHSMTANRAIALQDKAGTIALTSDIYDDDPSINNVYVVIHGNTNRPVPGGFGTSLDIKSFDGDKISLWDTSVSKWVPRTNPQSVIDMTAAAGFGNGVPFMPHDIFMYWDGAAVQYYVLPYGSALIKKTVTGITNATPPVLTVGSGHGFFVNDLVVLQDVTGGAASLTNTLYRVVATASTTVSLGNLAGGNIAAPGGTSSNGTLYKIDFKVTKATSFSEDRGVKYITVSGNRYKHIATVAYGQGKDQILDTYQFPFVWNRYNQFDRKITTKGTTTTTLSWTCRTTSDTVTNPRAMGNRYQERQWILVGDDGEKIDSELMILVFPPALATTAFNLHVSLDAIANYVANDFVNFGNSAEYIYNNTSTASFYAALRSHYRAQIPLGIHYLQPMELAYQSSTSDWTLFKSINSSQLNFHGGFDGSYLR